MDDTDELELQDWHYENGTLDWYFGNDTEQERDTMNNVTYMTRIDYFPDTLKRLGFDNSTNGPAISISIAKEGDLYRFTASGSANVGTTWIHDDTVAIEWGGDPAWYRSPTEGNDRDIIEAAINGDLQSL